MQINSVAVRYAQALFQLAKKNARVDAQMADLVKTRELLDSSEELRRAILSPTVPVPVKHQILKDVLARRVEPTTVNFFLVLVDKGREAIFGEIVEAFRTLLREERGELEVTIRVATPLDNAVAAQVKESLDKYTRFKVTLKVEVDPSLLGGMVIVIGDRMIDGSLKTQLEQIGERLVGAGAGALGGK